MFLTVTAMSQLTSGEVAVRLAVAFVVCYPSQTPPKFFLGCMERNYFPLIYQKEEAIFTNILKMCSEIQFFQFADPSVMEICFNQVLPCCKTISSAKEDGKIKVPFPFLKPKALSSLKLPCVHPAKAEEKQYLLLIQRCQRLHHL